MDPIINHQMLNLIFENRNKDYGAFEIRENYNRRLKRSFMYVILVLTIIPSLTLIPSGKPLMVNVPGKTIPGFGEKDEEMDGFLKYLQGNELPQNTEHAITVAGPDPETKKPEVEPSLPSDGSATIVNQEGNLFGSGFGKTASGGGNVIPALVPVKEIEKPIITHPDEWPEFPTESGSLQDYLDERLITPDDLGQEISMMIEFVVEMDGSISGVRMVKGDGYLAENLKQVLAGMPRWKPGKSGGRNVRVLCRMPVLFKP